LGVDNRDGPTWVALELTKLGEQKVEDGSIEDDLLDALDAPWHWPVFMPAKSYKRGGRIVTAILMEGYAFVGAGLDESAYFALEHHRNHLVSRVMSSTGAGGMRALKTVPESYIQALRERLREEVASDITVGMMVNVTDGTYANLTGVVIDVEGEYASVEVRLRSAHLIFGVPRYLLEPEDSD